MALSFKETLDAWNCTTMYWLRRVAYDRVPKQWKTFSTYLLSAIWHGLFMGYYMTFLTGALVTIAGRTVGFEFKRNQDPHFRSVDAFDGGSKGLNKQESCTMYSLSWLLKLHLLIRPSLS